MTDERQRWYREGYLRSSHWRAMRARILARAREHCEWCGRFCGENPHPGVEWCEPETRAACPWCWEYVTWAGEPNGVARERLEIHHRTYARLWHEQDEDLVALCWGCHDEITAAIRTLVAVYGHAAAGPHIAEREARYDHRLHAACGSSMPRPARDVLVELRRSGRLPDLWPAPA